MVSKQQIKRWNNSFNKLTPEEKRVAIAKDVIAQIKANKYYARAGTYVSVDSDVKIDRGASLQEHFDEISCNVCALGGLLMSHVKYNNNCTIENLTLISQTVIETSGLTNYFSKEQLFLIEIAFEGWEENEILDIDDNGNLYSLAVNQGIFATKYLLDNITNDLSTIRDKMKSAKLFGEKYNNDNDVLLAIMNNIVKNKGTFIP